MKSIMNVTSYELQITSKQVNKWTSGRGEILIEKSKNPQPPNPNSQPLNLNFQFSIFNFQLLIVLLLFSLFASCSPNKITRETAETIINQDSMINILTDIYLLDATLITALNVKKIKSKQTDDYYSFLLNKHQITKEQFDKSIRYYGRDRASLIKLYDEVLANLILIQTKLDLE